MPGKTLIERRFAGRDTDMAQLHLRLGPRQRRRSIEGGDVAMLVGKVEHGLPAGGDHGPESHADDRPGSDADAAAEGEDRIEHGAGGAGQPPSVEYRAGSAGRTAAAEKTGAVGFDLGRADGLSIDDGEMGRP